MARLATLLACSTAFPAVAIAQTPHAGQVGRLISADHAPQDKFGYALDLDGDQLIAGAPSRLSNGDDAGVAFLFERDGLQWLETADIAIRSEGAARISTSRMRSR